MKDTHVKMNQCYRKSVCLAPTGIDSRGKDIIKEEGLWPRKKKCVLSSVTLLSDNMRAMIPNPSQSRIISRVQEARNAELQHKAPETSTKSICVYMYL